MLHPAASTEFQMETKNSKLKLSGSNSAKQQMLSPSTQPKITQPKPNIQIFNPDPTSDTSKRLLTYGQSLGLNLSNYISNYLYLKLGPTLRSSRQPLRWVHGVKLLYLARKISILRKVHYRLCSCQLTLSLAVRNQEKICFSKLLYKHFNDHLILSARDHSVGPEWLTLLFRGLNSETLLRTVMIVICIKYFFVVDVIV